MRLLRWRTGSKSILKSTLLESRGFWWSWGEDKPFCCSIEVSHKAPDEQHQDESVDYYSRMCWRLHFVF